MTIEIDTWVTRREGRQLASDAADVTAAAFLLTRPDTGHATARVASAISALVTASDDVAERAAHNAEGLIAATRALLAVDEAVGLGIRWR